MCQLSGYTVIGIGCLINPSFAIHINEGLDNTSVTSSKAITENKWYFIEINRDSSNIMRIFINGELVASADIGSNFVYDANTYPQILWGNWGYTPTYSSNKFRGYLYDCTIYNGALHTSSYSVPSVYTLANLNKLKQY